MENFFENLENTLLEREFGLQTTENGAVAFKSTGKALLDLNFAVSSMRNCSEEEISRKFGAVCDENVENAVVWLFFARDARQGMGERRLFRVCLRYLADHYPEITDKVLPLIPEYGRWDDLFVLLDTKVHDAVEKLISDQLVSDLRAGRAGKSVSLLAKWMPSINSHNRRTRDRAETLARCIGLDRRTYQRLCSHLRKHINLVESKMSAGQWSDIDYSAVPSKANLVYNKAFFRHDEERRKAFLDRVKEGGAKINASVVYPYEIVRRYMDESAAYDEDDTLEAMWKALPDFVGDKGGSTIVVADGSGSMLCPVGGTRVTALDVANSLAIYFAEHLHGDFHNTYITFSERPQIVRLGDGNLASRLEIAQHHCEIANTNIEAVFNLILSTAVKKGMKQEDIPANVLIISDMEFDAAVGYFHQPDLTLFEEIQSRYAARGYQLPRLVFWNVCSRTMGIPLRENPNGVALVSGFSPAVADMVLSGELDPFKALMKTLRSPRYQPVWDAIAV